jgi:hypothetical protein
VTIGFEPDRSLQRIERSSAAICVAMAVLAFPLCGWGPGGPLGVFAGAALMAVSYGAIRGGVDAVAQRAASRANPSSVPAVSPRRIAWALTKFIARYGVLAIGAWVALVPLHASPLGLFAGVSAPVAAIAIEAIRTLRATRG